MTGSTAYRNLRAAVDAREPVTAETLAAVVEEMNSLPRGNEERAKLHRTLTAYASARTVGGRRPATGTVSLLDDASTRPSRKQDPAVRERVAKLRQRATSVLAEGKRTRKLSRAERTRRIGLAILEAEEAGVH